MSHFNFTGKQISTMTLKPNLIGKNNTRFDEKNTMNGFIDQKNNLKLNCKTGINIKFQDINYSIRKHLPWDRCKFNVMVQFLPLLSKHVSKCCFLKSINLSWIFNCINKKHSDKNDFGWGQWWIPCWRAVSYHWPVWCGQINTPRHSNRLYYEIYEWNYYSQWSSMQKSENRIHCPKLPASAAHYRLGGDVLCNKFESWSTTEIWWEKRTCTYVKYAGKNRIEWSHST